MRRAVAALLFIVSVGGTIYLCSSMDTGMQMPGGRTMSMAWMRMPGQRRSRSASRVRSVLPSLRQGLWQSSVPSRYDPVLPK